MNQLALRLEPRPKARNPALALRSARRPLRAPRAAGPAVAQADRASGRRLGGGCCKRARPPTRRRQLGRRASLGVGRESGRAMRSCRCRLRREGQDAALPGEGVRQEPLERLAFSLASEKRWPPSSGLGLRLLSNMSHRRSPVSKIRSPILLRTPPNSEILFGRTTAGMSLVSRLGRRLPLCRLGADRSARLSD